MAGDGARLKDFSLRGKGDRGEVCDRLTSCTLLNKSWTGGLEQPNPYSPQEHSLFVFVEQARKPVLDRGARYQNHRKS